MYSNLWVSLCAAVFSCGFSIQYKTEPIPFFIFFSTLFVYTGQRLYKIWNNQIHTETPRVIWMKENQNLSIAILVMAGIGSLITGFYLFRLETIFNTNLNENTFLFRGIILAFSFLISVLYVVRIRKRNLRELPFIKIFLVVGVYVFLCCVLPFSSFKDVRWTSSDGHFLFEIGLFVNALFVFGIALLFDTSDIEVDPLDQRTIPQVIGVSRSIYLSAGLIAPQALMMFFVHRDNTFNLSILVIFMLFYIGFWKYKKTPMYINFWGEAMLAFVGLFNWFGL